MRAFKKSGEKEKEREKGGDRLLLRERGVVGGEREGVRRANRNKWEEEVRVFNLENNGPIV